MICPHRLLERRQIFVDCLHLLTGHQPGNELHIVPELSVPGGSVDYALASVRDGRVSDFVGIELQTLDSTGTIWPERQRFLHGIGYAAEPSDVNSDKPFGMNWKMSAKTILLQLHHKITTFQGLNKYLVLVVQDVFLEYMSREFSFGHISVPARPIEQLQMHGYQLERRGTSWAIQLAVRWSTDSAGVQAALGLGATAHVELESINSAIAAKISQRTLFSPI